MELLWLSEGSGIDLDGGSVGFGGYVTIVGGCCGTLNRLWLWIGLDSWVAIGCWRVL